MAHTKKDYEMVADILRDGLTGETESAVRMTIEYLARKFANRFEQDNPKFDREKFFKWIFGE